jgi:hypothetical protein
MVSKFMRGRLGNQLFQYATARKIQLINDDKELSFNFSKYVESKGFEDELKYFKVVPYKTTNNIKITLKQRILIFYYKVIKRLIRLFDKEHYYEKRYNLENRVSEKLIKNGLYWKEDGRLNIQPTKYNNKLLIGHFESKENFDDIRDVLLNELEPKEEVLDKNKDLYNKILNTNSICITIRRGDYVTNSNFAKVFNICDINYYNKAIELIKTKVDNPTFFVFSDDVEWCRNNINIDGEVYYEDGTDPVWEKLRLMYSCKHFIISNSTFSWWAQYLSRNDDKVVVAPSRWANTGYPYDIYDNKWYKIDL